MIKYFLAILLSWASGSVIASSQRSHDRTIEAIAESLIATAIVRDNLSILPTELAKQNLQIDFCKDIAKIDTKLTDAVILYKDASRPNLIPTSERLP